MIKKIIWIMLFLIIILPIFTLALSNANTVWYDNFDGAAEVVGNAPTNFSVMDGSPVMTINNDNFVSSPNSLHVIGSGSTWATMRADNVEGFTSNVTIEIDVYANYTGLGTGTSALWLFDYGSNTHFGIGFLMDNTGKFLTSNNYLQLGHCWIAEYTWTHIIIKSNYSDTGYTQVFVGNNTECGTFQTCPSGDCSGFPFNQFRFSSKNGGKYFDNLQLYHLFDTDPTFTVTYPSNSYATINEINYTKNLYFNISSSGIKQNNIVLRYINKINDLNYSINTSVPSILKSYATTTEGPYNISFRIYGFNDFFGNASFTNLHPSLNITFSSYATVSNNNYARNLSYSIAYAGLFSNYTIFRYINGVRDQNISIWPNITISGSYTHPTEGKYNISFILTISELTTFFETEGGGGTHYTILYILNDTFSNSTFISDLYSPNISLSYITGIFGTNKTNISMTCTDNLISTLTYNLTFNSNLLTYSNYTNNTEIKNSSRLSADRSNLIYGSCSDFLGKTEKTIDFTLYNIHMLLIDEIDNTPFNLNNCTTAKLYFDSNNNSYNIKGSSTPYIDFISPSNGKIRVELSYAAGEIILRYIDLSLVPDELRICANKEGITHYQQLIISSSEKKAVVKNSFTDCYVAADYTRFGYQNAYLLKAYTIDAPYFLYTYTDGVQTFLSNIDGGISSYINLDTLVFSKTAYNIDYSVDALKTSKVDDVNQILVYYYNIKNDTDSLSLTVTNLDTNEAVYSYDSFTNPNEFSLYIDFTTWTNYTNSTLFLIELDKTKDGITTTIKEYMGLNGNTARWRPAFAIIFSVLLVFFGLTLASLRITFSWFGLMMVLAAIFILSLAIQTWYVLFLMTIYVIILIYIFITLLATNPQSIEG